VIFFVAEFQIIQWFHHCLLSRVVNNTLLPMQWFVRNWFQFLCLCIYVR